jgi:hypothetical protein
MSHFSLTTMLKPLKFVPYIPKPANPTAGGTESSTVANVPPSCEFILSIVVFISLSYDNAVHGRSLKRSLTEPSALYTGSVAEDDFEGQIQSLETSPNSHVPGDIVENGSKRRRMEPPAVQPNNTLLSVHNSPSQFLHFPTIDSSWISFFSAPRPKSSLSVPKERTTRAPLPTGYQSIHSLNTIQEFDDPSAHDSRQTASVPTEIDPQEPSGDLDVVAPSAVLTKGQATCLHFLPGFTDS